MLLHSESPPLEVVSLVLFQMEALQLEIVPLVLLPHEALPREALPHEALPQKVVPQKDVPQENVPLALLQRRAVPPEVLVPSFETEVQQFVAAMVRLRQHSDKEVEEEMNGMVELLVTMPLPER